LNAPPAELIGSCGWWWVPATVVSILRKGTGTNESLELVHVLNTETCDQSHISSLDPRPGLAGPERQPCRFCVFVSINEAGCRQQ
jgi:hypothetical protein